MRKADSPLELRLLLIDPRCTFPIGLMLIKHKEIVCSQFLPDLIQLIVKNVFWPRAAGGKTGIGVQKHDSRTPRPVTHPVQNQIEVRFSSTAFKQIVHDLHFGLALNGGHGAEATEVAEDGFGHLAFLSVDVEGSIGTRSVVKHLEDVPRPVTTRQLQ
jgi:hypothetical protein